jgi:UDP-2,3-diacylglucosamine pyrophosphatase LpxH
MRPHTFETIYLVGDIIDIWRLKRRKYWVQSHTDVVRKILKRSKYGRVIYIVGNHDEFLLNFTDVMDTFGNIHVCQEYIHETADGRRLLVTHGHQFDGVTQYAPIVAYLGDCAYEWLITLTRWCHYLCRKFGWEYRSLSAYAKQKVKSAVNFISNYEKSVCHYALSKNVQGIVCGHIHHPSIKKFGQIEYYNCGDWVDSCSCLVEDFDGNMHLLDGVTETTATANEPTFAKP